MNSISVVTVAYNAERTIKETLVSVQAMLDAGAVQEYIVIDGASTDRTLEYVAQYAPGAIVVSEKDNGIYDAMNKGVALAKCDYVHLLNADDSYCLSPDEFKKQIASLSSSVVSFDVDYVLDSARTDRLYFDGNLVDSAPHPGLIISKSLYSAYPFDLTYRFAADIDFMLKALKPSEVRRVPLVLVKMASGGAGGTVASVQEAASIYLKRKLIRRWLHCQIAIAKLRIKQKLMRK